MSSTYLGTGVCHLSLSPILKQKSSLSLSLKLPRLKVRSTSSSDNWKAPNNSNSIFWTKWLLTLACQSVNISPAELLCSHWPRASAVVHKTTIWECKRHQSVPTSCPTQGQSASSFFHFLLERIPRVYRNSGILIQIPSFRFPSWPNTKCIGVCGSW